MIALLNPDITRSFKDAERQLGVIDAGVAANVVAAASDLAMIVDGHGQIADLAFSGGGLKGDGVSHWVGRRLIETVVNDSRNKIEAMLGELETAHVSRRREINFALQDDESLPMSCIATKLGDNGRIVIFGRDLRGVSRLQQRLVNTQISMEREYTRLRQTEACYRLLFQLVGEAVLIVDTSSLAVTDANPVASALLDVPVAKIVGRRVAHVFGSKDRDAVRALLASTQAVGSAIAADLSGKDGLLFTAKASLFRQADISHILIRLMPNAESHKEQAIVEGGQGNPAINVIEKLPDGFVIIDEKRRVKRANAAFLDLVQAASFDQVKDQSIDTWFERSSVDANVLIANVREHGLVRRFSTSLRGNLGGSEEVEITAVSVTSDQRPLYGMVMRRALRTASEETPITGFPAQSAEQLTDLIGHMSLKEVVRETTDVVERLCIDAALKLTGDNRASAAQMLGVSRQSLYAKMRRFGLGDLASEPGV